MSPPPFWTRIYLRWDPALPRCRWETSARKPYGCIYSQHPGCHTFGNTRLRLPCIGFFITETLSTGVSLVAAWSRVPRRTTRPSLRGYAGCWFEVTSTTSMNSTEHFQTRAFVSISSVNATATLWAFFLSNASYKISVLKQSQILSFLSSPF